MGKQSPERPGSEGALKFRLGENKNNSISRKMYRRNDLGRHGKNVKHPQGGIRGSKPAGDLKKRRK